MEPLSTAIAIGTAAAPWFGEWVTVGGGAERDYDDGESG